VISRISILSMTFVFPCFALAGIDAHVGKPDSNVMTLGYPGNYQVPPFHSATRSPASVPECSKFVANTDLQFIRNQIRLEGSKRRTVDHYRLASNTIIFTSLTNSPGCILIERDGNVLYSGPSPSLISLPNRIYGMLQNSQSVDFPQARPSPEMQRLMTSFNIDLALVLNIDNHYPAPFDTSWKKILTGVAFHEGFHLFYQPILFKQNKYLWPAWSLGNGMFDLRDRLGTDCYYANDATKKFVKAEIDQLKLALDPRTPVVSIGKTIEEFLELRSERYNLLKQTKVGKYSCEMIENELELVEGMARFVEISALNQLGLVTDDPLIAMYFNYYDNDSELYYQLGMLQMLVLERLNPGESMKIVINAILSSTKPEDSVVGQTRKAATMAN
jgi:hypothetical protein